MMKLTKTFNKTAQAYKSKARFIVNVGGTRSSKTYSTLQLLYLIAKQSNKKRIIHVVSHSTPHLKDGAITDFEHILNTVGENIGNIRVQNPNTYTINQSIIKFIGFDTSGKAHGAKRDILFVNECNYMKYEVLDQLFIRTRECIFLDYNPSAKFWIDDVGLLEREDTVKLHSTFLDNIENLTKPQVEELYEKKKLHDAEKLKGVQGYFYNWWRVYGLGLRGQIQGVILTNWSTGEFNNDLQFGYCSDFGMRDPFTLTKIAVDKRARKLWVHQEIYQSDFNPVSMVDAVAKRITERNKIIICDSARPDLIDMLVRSGFNAQPCLPKSKLATINLLQSYEVIITPTSQDIINEFYTYKWKDRASEMPEDGNDHSIDAIGYYLRWFDYSY
jgi:phage terminase large subunit